MFRISKLQASQINNFAWVEKQMQLKNVSYLIIFGAQSDA